MPEPRGAVRARQLDRPGRTPAPSPDPTPQPATTVQPGLAPDNAAGAPAATGARDVAQRTIGNAALNARAEQAGTARAGTPATPPAGGTGTAPPARTDAPGQARETGEASGGSAGGASDAIRILGSALPSRASTALASSRASAETELAAERQALTDNPPSVDAPSGLSRAGRTTTTEEAEGSAARQQSPAAIDAQRGEGSEPAAAPTSHEASTAPVPEGPSPESVVSFAPEEPIARVAAYRQSLARMPVSDDSVNTDPGPAPVLELTEAADPNRLDAQAAQTETTLSAEDITATRDMQTDEGVDDIYPSLPDDVLVAPITSGSGSIPQLAEHETPPLRAEVEAGFNSGAANRWGAETADAEREHAAAVLDRQDSETRERAETERQVAELDEAAADEQRGYREAARTDVATARAGWRTELDQAREGYDGENQRLQDNLDEDIDQRVTQADDDAAEQMDRGHAQAEQRRQTTESEAARRRREAEQRRQQADGFFDWISSRVKAFFRRLQEGLKALFNALRKAVEVIIEGAKKLAAAAIELGRRAVIGLIRVAGAALELAADVFLAAFPRARERAKALIRRGVERAEDAVNRAAEALRAAVFALLDALGAALNFILDVFEAFYSGLFRLIEFLVVGMIEIQRGLYRLELAAYYSPDELEGQIYEEMLGADLTQPLAFEATPAEIAAWEQSMAAPGVADEVAGEMAPGEVAVDQVADFAPDPELLASLDFDETDEIEFGENNDPDNTLAALQSEAGGEASAGDMGEETAGDGSPGSAINGETTDEKLEHYINGPSPQTCSTETPTTQEGSPVPLSHKIGPLTRTQRAKYMLAQAWTGIKHWVGCNWPLLLAAVLAAIVVIALIVVVVVLSGGTVGVALTGLLTAFTAGMVIYAIARVGGFLLDYLEKSWGGDIIGGAKALARSVAIAAVEIIFAILTYVTAGAFRVVAAGVKGVGRLASATARGAGHLARGARRAAQATGRGLSRTGRAVTRATGRVGSVVARRGRIIVRGVRNGFERGARSLRALGRRLGRRLRFRRFKIVRRGRWFELFGLINPWVLLANGRVEEIDLPAGTRVGSRVDVPGSRVQGIVIGQSQRGGQQVRSSAVRQIENLSERARTRLHRTLRDRADDDIRRALASRREVREAAASFRHASDVGPAGVNRATWYHDALGRLRRARANLQRVHKVSRSSAETTAQRAAGRAGNAGDEGGHAIAHRFLGDQGIRNMFAQAGRLNRSAWKKLENEWADWIKAGYKVDVDARFVQLAGNRPGGIAVRYNVINPNTGKIAHTGNPFFRNIPNETYQRVARSAMPPP